MREIARTVSRILHVFDPAFPHFTYRRGWLAGWLAGYCIKTAKLILKLF